MSKPLGSDSTSQLLGMSGIKKNICSFLCFIVGIWFKGPKISIETIFWQTDTATSSAEIFPALPNQMAGKNLIWEWKHLQTNRETNKYPYAATMSSACTTTCVRFDAYVLRAALRSERWQVRRACTKRTTMGRVRAQWKCCTEKLSHALKGP